MSDQVRGIVFVIISLLILFAWGHFYKPPVPPPQVGPTQTSAPVSQLGTQQSAAQGGGAAGNAIGSANSTVKATAPANSSVVAASDEKTVVVESLLSRVELSNRGGVVKTWELKKFFDDQKPPHPLDLVNDSVAKELGWPFSLVLSDPQMEAKANSGLYEIETHIIPSAVAYKSELKLGNFPLVP